MHTSVYLYVAENLVNRKLRGGRATAFAETKTTIIAAKTTLSFPASAVLRKAEDNQGPGRSI
jgi:hypothetical protein